MNINRRKMFRNTGLVMSGAVAATIPMTTLAEEKPFDLNAEFPEIRKFIELPMTPGDLIVALTSHRGKLYAATKYGNVYEIGVPVDW